MLTIKLKSTDGVIFEEDVEVVKCSGTIKTMIENCGCNEGNDAVVPLLRVNSHILRKVLEWANQHKNDPEPESEDISSWDKKFFKVDQGTLFEILLAANYLEIEGLLTLTCKTVANMIKGKTPEEIRKTFNIKNDLTVAKEEEIRNYFSWCSAE